jgi:arabinogalactan oligomer / maltooligosaccharide transport system substrate-binding protein
LGTEYITVSLSATTGYNDRNLPHSESDPVSLRQRRVLWRAATGLLFFGALGAALLLAACSGSRGPQPAPAPQPAPDVVTPANRPAASGPISITYWEEDSDDAGVLLDELTAAFIAANPGITVTRVHYSYNDLRNQFRNDARAGRGPELVRAPGEFAGPFAELQIVRPLDELFSDDYLHQYLRGSLQGATVKGKLWGMPDTFGNHLMLIYNRGLFSGTVAANTDGWLKQLQGLTRTISTTVALTDTAVLTDTAAISATGGITTTTLVSHTYGLVYPLNEAYWLVPWLAGYGGWPLDAQDQPALDTAEMVRALTFVRDLKARYGVVPADADYDRAFDLFARGEAAFSIDGAWNLDRYKGLGIDLGIVLLPRVSETELLPAPMATGRYWYIAQGTDPAKLDAVARFVEFMTSAESQAQWLDKMHRLPSIADVAENQDAATADPLLPNIMAQLKVARGVPPALEMSCAWQGMAAFLPRVMAGEVSPEDAAPAMQAQAEACLADMTPDATPTPAATP